MKTTTTFLLAILTLFISFTSCDKDPVTPEPLKVLVLGADNADWIKDVSNKIDSTELFGTVDTFNLAKHTPTLELLNMYDAIFVYTNDDAYDEAAASAVLADYIENGGGVVDATFTANIPISGDFTQYSLYTLSGQVSSPVRTLGTVANSSHYIMENILSFNGGTSSYHNTDGTIAANATVLASYDNSDPLVIIKENVGPKNVKRVFLNFFPPSKNVRADFWDPSTDGALIMGYALVWVAN